VQTWRLHAFPIEPLTADFPFARTLVVVRSERTIKKTGQTTTESRYYLSSAPAPDHTPRQWLERIRGHWGGVENRNHWRRDALMGEDDSRSRHPTLLANVALIRNVLLQVLAEQLQQQSLPQLRESLHSHPGRCLALLTKS
jgi:predicted transposase YbfD/YdcC